ncbi:hypothetical protein PARA125_001908 [Parachlamydia sp. AcF125]|nr:hypothetical protein [Parachlamydia sp. AcF125]
MAAKQRILLSSLTRFAHEFSNPFPLAALISMPAFSPIEKISYTSFGMIFSG